MTTTKQRHARIFDRMKEAKREREREELDEPETRVTKKTIPDWRGLAPNRITREDGTW